MTVESLVKEGSFTNTDGFAIFTRTWEPPTSSPRAVLVIVIGHWLLSVMTYRDGTFGRDKIIELCHGDDPICNPTDPNNWQDYWPDHLAPAYIKAGMVNQAADFVAGRI